MSKTFIVAVTLAALSACAATEKEAAAAPVVYTVLEADASIPFASSGIRNFRVGKDAERSLLLEGPQGRWYRATLQSYCRSALPWEQAIAYKTDATDRFDKFSSVVIDGRSCQVQALDRIADPDAPATPPAS
jgi:hypothetical protein